jgi:hypothetical protein
METNRLFLWVGRLNQLLLLAAAILVILVGGWSLAQILQGYLGEGRFVEARPAGEPGDGRQPAAAPRLEIELSQTLRAGGLVVLSVTARQDRAGGFSSYKTAQATVNLLLVDLERNTTRRMLPNDRAFVREHMQILARMPDERGERPVLGLLAAVVERDTNGDGALSQDDDATLLVWPLDAQAPTRFGGVNRRILGVHASETGHVVIVEEADGFRRYDLADATLTPGEARPLALFAP